MSCPGYFNVIVYSALINNNKMNMWDSDMIVQQWLQDNDETSMPMPSMESEPHLLISKVRKHYMEYLIKLLAVNYESSQKLMNKNIYLPSAIWRCAKLLELSAAKSCMVVQLYRQNVLTVIKELKEMTKKGKLYKQLYTCLRIQPENEKRTQVSFTIDGCECQCSCGVKRKKRVPMSQHHTLPHEKIELAKCDPSSFDTNQSVNTKKNPPQNQISSTEKEASKTDDIVQQLEELFQGIPDDDDIFEGAFDMPTTVPEKVTTPIDKPAEITMTNTAQAEQNLEDRLAALSGILSNMDSDVKTTKNNKTKPHHTSKWMCEEYFLKVKLYEKLDEIRENRRTKFNKIKNTMIDLFGYDSDGEGVVSPIDETPEFITSCKERIAPWVVKILNPYYVKGRIRGKMLFKSLAKHLIKLIYQCSKYPFEYEVQSFVQDFLESHKMIRCEADFAGFKIENM